MDVGGRALLLRLQCVAGDREGAVEHLVLDEIPTRLARGERALRVLREMAVLELAELEAQMMGGVEGAPRARQSRHEHILEIELIDQPIALAAGAIGLDLDELQ